MNKREIVLNLLQPDQPQEYTPAGFFIHFDPACHFGQAAVDKHLEYFHHTGMDLVKIQYERSFPYQPDIERPKDWHKMPLFGKDFFQPQLEAVAGLVKAAKEEAVVIVTLYSPFMCAGQASKGLIQQHLQENPEQAQKGIEIVAESLRFFVRECIKLGVDGQSCFGRRVADEVNYDSLTDKWPSSPVVRNVAEHPVFDLIPLTRAGREVAHRQP